MNKKRSTNNFSKQTAKASWISALIALGVMVFGESAQESPIGGLIIGGIAVLLFFTGITFGIIGLFGTRKYGKKAIMKPSIIGLILNVGLLSIFLLAAYSGYQHQLKKNDYYQFSKSINDLNKKAREEAIETGEVSGETIEQYLSMNDEFNKIIETKKGEEKRALQAVAKIRDMIQEYVFDYIKKAKALEENNIWNFVSLKEEGDYASRYKLIQDAHVASEQCLKFIETIDAHIDELLEKENIENDLKDKVKSTFLASIGNKNKSKKLYEINCDQLMIMLKMFKLLEENQEEWNIENDQLVFFDEYTLNKYNDFFAKISLMDNEKIKIISNK